MTLSFPRIIVDPRLNPGEWYILSHTPSVDPFSLDPADTWPGLAGIGPVQKKDPPERLPEDKLRCPIDGCQRPRPYETETGTLKCWHCGYEGSWHDFPAQR